MKSPLLSVLALCSLAGRSVATTATLVNSCSFNVYFNTGQGSSQLGPGTSNSMAMQGSGKTIRIGVTPSLPNPMQFDYSITDNIYYDLSTKNGDPFMQQGFSLVPSISSCHAIHCSGRSTNDCSDVYNPSGNTAVFACSPSASSFTLTTCG